MTNGTRRVARALRRGVPAAILAAALATGPGAIAQATGEIAGKVVNGTRDAPVRDTEVTLQLFSAEADLGTLSTTTDAKGRFAFDDLPAELAGYQLAVEYGGAVYRSVATAYTPGSSAEGSLTVWEPTRDPEAVSLDDYVVWVDREGEGVAIQHDLAWSNAGDTAYVGDGGGVVTIPLPEGANALQFLGTFLENPGDVRAGAYVSDAPIVPGDTSATLRYNAPPLSLLTLEVPFPTRSLQLFVPQDVRVTATALRLAGTVSDQGVTYQVYAAQDLAAGTTIDVRMSQAAGDGSGTEAVWVVIGVAAALALATLVAVVVRRRRPNRDKAPAARRAPPRAAADVGTLGARPAGNGKGGGHVVEDPDLIVEEIAALDLSFERGLIDERAYRRLRVAAKDRLLRAEQARPRGGRVR